MYIIIEYYIIDININKSETKLKILTYAPKIINFDIL